jgi:hypothetical protein
MTSGIETSRVNNRQPVEADGRWRRALLDARILRGHRHLVPILVEEMLRADRHLKALGQSIADLLFVEPAPLQRPQFGKTFLDNLQ